MKTYLENLYEHEFNKLFKIAHEIEPWYTVDKVKKLCGLYLDKRYR